MPTITPKVVFRSAWVRWMPPHVAAITIGQTIHVRGPTITATQLAHEITHVKQFASRGLFRGLCEYLLLSALYGYDHHPWEQEARRAERGHCPTDHCQPPTTNAIPF